MAAWLAGLPLIALGVVVAWLLRRRGPRAVRLFLFAGGAVALAALVVLLVALTAEPSSASHASAAARAGGGTAAWAALLGAGIAVGLWLGG